MKNARNLTRRTLITAATVVCLSLPTVAEADVNLGIAAAIGTTGYGGHVSIPVVETLNARLGFNYFSYNFSGNPDVVDYKFKLKLNTVDALADWHPFNGSFRLTGGLVWNGNKIDAKAKASGGEYEFDGNKYNGDLAGDVKGRIEFRDVAPYLGLGWGSAPRSRGLYFSSDYGVIFQGKPSVTLKNRNCQLPGDGCSRLANDLAEEEKELEDYTKDFRYYPVIRFSLGFRF